MSRPDQKRLGNKIRELRKAMNLTMQQLADLVGVNYTTIYRVETGKVSPSVVLLSDIAYQLGYSITGLLEEERSKLTLIRAKDQPLVESDRMALRLLMPKGIINDKISISLGKGSAGEMVDRHETPGYELSYVIRGKCVFKYGEKDHMLEQGDLVYFDGKVKHGVTALEPLEFLAIYFRD